MMTILKTITISASRPTDDNALFIISACYILSITLNVEALYSTGEFWQAVNIFHRSPASVDVAILIEFEW